MMSKQNLCTSMKNSCSERFAVTFTVQIWSSWFRVTTEWVLKGMMIKSKTDHSAYMSLQENKKKY